ncbi:MAG TPA: hypothetical protein PLI07_01515, partial [Candidatus Hydrogenedentes bacterium]|nr:hypothetical protein [Candidatus Hydrogenedentota bacterium]
RRYKAAFFNLPQELGTLKLFSSPTEKSLLDASCPITTLSFGWEHLRCKAQEDEPLCPPRFFSNTKTSTSKSTMCADAGNA